MTESDSSPVLQNGQETRRLLRSRRDRMIGGVCGGLGRYLNVDPVLLRIAAVALALAGGVGVLAYLVAWVLIPGRHRRRSRALPGRVRTGTAPRWSSVPR